MSELYSNFQQKFEMMRISEIEKTTIVNEILEKDKDAQIFLFDSVTDDFKKGGDILLR